MGAGSILLSDRAKAKLVEASVGSTLPPRHLSVVAGEGYPGASRCRIPHRRLPNGLLWTPRLRLLIDVHVHSGRPRRPLDAFSSYTALDPSGGRRPLVLNGGVHAAHGARQGTARDGLTPPTIGARPILAREAMGFTECANTRRCSPTYLYWAESWGSCLGGMPTVSLH